jgi:hypothetical protein
MREDTPEKNLIITLELRHFSKGLGVSFRVERFKSYEVPVFTD